MKKEFWDRWYKKSVRDLKLRQIANVVKIYERVLERLREETDFETLPLQIKKAKKIMPRYKGMDPEVAGLLNNIAWNLATGEKKNAKLAIKLAKMAVELYPLPAYLDTLAEAYYQAGMAGKAIEVIKEAIKKAPDNKYFQEQLKKFSKANVFKIY
jgi:tetratricopeptide (TPR) repeat protein